VCYSFDADFSRWITVCNTEAEAQMASVASLREHLVEELNDLLNAEEQLTEALPLMAESATSRELRTAFRSHLAETKQHLKRVTQALRQLGERATGNTCEAMEGLLEEGQALMNATEAGALRDAMMITAAQKVEHYEIASYGTVRTYAQVIGERGVAKLLQQTLKEEHAADRKLTTIAQGSINRRASQEWNEQTGMLEQGARWMGSTVGGALKRVMPRSVAADQRRTKARTSSTRKRGARGRKRARSSSR
jgi:ferritin-like metal-binding protein YciE